MFVSLIRTVILYALIVCTVRLMGKRQIGELEPTELVATILISDLAAVPMQDIGIPLLSGVIPILTLLSLELLTAEASLRSIRFRSLLCGKPVFLIQDGIIDQNAMRKTRISLDELQECLREQGLLDIAKVKYAVLETSGKISAFPDPAYSPVTPRDLQILTRDLEYPISVISDGRVLDHGLASLGQDRTWLLTELKGTAPSEVFLMTATKSGISVIIRKEAKL